MLAKLAIDGPLPAAVLVDAWGVVAGRVAGTKGSLRAADVEKMMREADAHARRIAERRSRRRAEKNQRRRSRLGCRDLPARLDAALCVSASRPRSRAGDEEARSRRCRGEVMAWSCAAETSSDFRAEPEQPTPPAVPSTPLAARAAASSPPTSTDDATAARAGANGAASPATTSTRPPPSPRRAGATV